MSVNFTKSSIDNKFTEMLNNLAPNGSPADTVAGELLNAVNHISYQFTQNGIEIGSVDNLNGEDNAARYLVAKIGLRPDGMHIETILHDMWMHEPVEEAGEVEEYFDAEDYVEAEKAYDFILDCLKHRIVAYIEDHPILEKTPNDESFYDYDETLEKLNPLNAEELLREGYCLDISEEDYEYGLAPLYRVYADYYVEEAQRELDENKEIDEEIEQ